MFMLVRALVNERDVGVECSTSDRMGEESPQHDKAALRTSRQDPPVDQSKTTF